MDLFGIKWDEHGAPVIIAIALSVLYIVLSAFTEIFRSIAVRFAEILGAFTKDFTVAYALVPIYIGWFIADYFQERKGTNYGNAMSNGFMGLWVSMDWIKTAHGFFTESGNTPFFAIKTVLAGVMLAYTFIVMRAAAKGQRIAHFIGRIREISYFAIILSPVVYEIVPMDGVTIIAGILFFPVIYGLAELVDFYILPPPELEAVEEEEEAKGEIAESGGESGNSEGEEFKV